MSQPYEHRFKDPAVRLVRESDILAVIELFKLNYGGTYAYQEVYNGRWLKSCMYGDEAICVVFEDADRVVGCGALILAYGDYNDQIGELARLVVDPEKTGCGVGSRIINALLELAEAQVEFAIADCRTAHTFSQRRVEEAGMTALGILRRGHYLDGKREDQVLYGKLLGNAASLRSARPLQLIPEVAPLAQHVLTSMGLPATIAVIEDCDPYPDDKSPALQPMDRLSLARLRQVKQGRVSEPLLFGPLSLDQGHAFIKRHNAEYLIAVDENQRPCGAIGFREDSKNKNLTGIELIAESPGLRGRLCRALSTKAESSGAELVEVTVSAYDARLQRTFYELGFRAIAFAPALVFHGIERLDAVRMSRLNIPYDGHNTKLTNQARAVSNVIEAFK